MGIDFGGIGDAHSLGKEGKKGAMRIRERAGRMSVIVALAALCLTIQGEVLAQGPAGQPPMPSFGERLMQMMPMLLMVYVIFYILVIRPRQSEEKAQQKFLEGLKRGDPVITASGLFGKIVSLDPGSITLEIAPTVKVRVERRTVIKREESEQSSAQ